MTAVALRNPYLDKYRRIMRTHDDFGAYTERRRLVARYAWAVPDEAAIAAIADLGLPVVEMGAGTGYWAMLLAKAGVDILAYDTRASHFDEQRFGRYHPVARRGPRKLRHHSDRALMLCWPPYAEPMALRSITHWRGRTLIYIGEPEGGCSGCDQFHHRLARQFDLVREVPIPQWPGIHDALFIYRRLA